MWDRIEVWARQIRYGFFILTIAVFIATYWTSFQDNKPLLYLFLISGFLWMLSIAYVDIREAARFARGMRKKTPLERSNHRQGRNKIMKWLRTHAFGVGIIIVFGAATALYFIPFNTPRPWWGAVLALIGPLVMWLTRRVELRGRDNENLIRQIEPLIEDTGDLEFTIRGFARDLLGKPDVKNEIGSFGVEGWTYYIERLGDQQISALNSLRIELKDTDPFEDLHVRDVLISFNQILGRVLEVESRLSPNLCQKITSIPGEVQTRWEYIQQTHQRLGTQLSSLKPILNKMGQADLFERFINQTPQNLRATT